MIPEVSILIPFKNTGIYLSECISSVQDQHFTSWEIIAVDDHSQDNSNAILHKFAANDARITILTNTGRGIIEALRTAYKVAKGTYITRMDSDDIMLPEKLKTMVSALKKERKGTISLGLVHYFSAKGIGDGYKRYEEWLNALTINGNNFDERYKECVIPSPCWMMHRTDLDLCGAFDSDRYPEDYDLAFRMYAAGFKCIPSNKLLHLWRDYDSRSSRTSAHYAQNYFLKIKLYYFLKLDHVPDRPLVIWGAGTKGKNVASQLVQLKISFIWVCDNPKKIGKEIYGKTLESYKEIVKIPNPQSIITVANEKAQQQIRHYLASLSQLPLQDYYFFC